MIVHAHSCTSERGVGGEERPKKAGCWERELVINGIEAALSSHNSVWLAFVHLVIASCFFTQLPGGRERETERNREREREGEKVQRLQSRLNVYT